MVDIPPRKVVLLDETPGCYSADVYLGAVNANWDVGAVHTRPRTAYTHLTGDVGALLLMHTEEHAKQPTPHVFSFQQLIAMTTELELPFAIIDPALAAGSTDTSEVKLYAPQGERIALSEVTTWLANLALPEVTPAWALQT